MEIFKTASRACLAGVMRRYPFYSGGPRLCNHRLARWAAGDDVVLTSLRDGTVMWADQREFLGRAVYYTGDYDRKLSWACAMILRPGDVLLDVGANIGVVALPAARIVGHAGAVHAFEPQTDYAALIERSARANGFDNVTVHPVALSDRDGEAPLFVPAADRSMASLGRDAPGAQHRAATVRHTDRYLESLGLRAVRLLKLDVEGHEAVILENATRFFASTPPDAIIFESNDPDPREHREISFLRRLGYTVVAFRRSTWPIRLSKVESHGRANDFLAFRTDDVASLVARFLR